jgi:DNA polymerase elongation subunit (family B)
MNYITFDIETYTPEDKLSITNGRIDTKLMQTSVTGAYISWLDKYIVFWEEDITDFIALLKEADLIVGFNHVWFDLPVLQKYADYNLLSTLHCYDILTEVEKKVGYKLKLDNLAKNNLAHSKTDSYANFKDYHLQNKWSELANYCMHDVLITEQIFQLILKKTPLKYNDMLSIKEAVLDLPTLKRDIVASHEELF